MLTLVETALFSRQMEALWTLEEYWHFQWHLLHQPESGAIIRGSGGFRKIRWSRVGHGKSSGVRVIYYLATEDGMLFLLSIYAKSEQEDLTPAQLMILRKRFEEDD